MIRYRYLNSLSIVITKEIEMCYPRRNDCALTVLCRCFRPIGSIRVRGSSDIENKAIDVAGFAFEALSKLLIAGNVILRYRTWTSLGTILASPADPASQRSIHETKCMKNLVFCRNRGSRLASGFS